MIVDVVLAFKITNKQPSEKVCVSDYESIPSQTKAYLTMRYTSIYQYHHLPRLPHSDVNNTPVQFCDRYS